MFGSSPPLSALYFCASRMSVVATFRPPRRYPVAIGGQVDIRWEAQNDVRDPFRHFEATACNMALDLVARASPFSVARRLVLAASSAPAMSAATWPPALSRSFEAAITWSLSGLDA